MDICSWQAGIRTNLLVIVRARGVVEVDVYLCTHISMLGEKLSHKTLGKKENRLLCWQQLFPNPRPWAILCSQAGYYMATIRGAGAQHLVVSYSGPSVAADCTVSQPGGPPSMTLASHSRVNQEPAIIQWVSMKLIQTASFYS